ncbi:prenyltransferase [Xylaria palmicola]|nr:prenyltransferase [Xylaria palmicola]
MSNERKSPECVAPPCTSNDKPVILSQQYGGFHSGSWVEVLPRFAVPFIQLARLSPPTALFLIYLPHVFGVLHTGIAHRLSWAQVISTALQLFGGSFFFSNAAHAWNDIVDAPIDRHVARSKDRPIVRGAITPSAALAFAFSQSFGAITFLLWLPRTTALATLPTIVGTTYYPWAKRHTYFPQVVLGFCLAWGIIVGCAAAGEEEPWKDGAALCLVMASVLWTVTYDTIYASLDIQDDIKIGIKSMAVLFGTYTKIMLWVVTGLQSAHLVAYGWLTMRGIGYYTVTVAGCLVSLAVMVSYVKLGDKASCWWWFSCGFWFVGMSVISGLLIEYVLQ